MTRRGFEARTIRVSVDEVLPVRSLGRDVRKTAKFKPILASVREVGVVEPLAVFREPAAPGGAERYVLLDGHLRLEALKALGRTEVVCLVSTDDEGFTYNRQVNRISAVQEHRMIVQAIAKGVKPERIALALNVDVERIRERQRLLEGIAPEVVELLKDRMVSRSVFSMLRKIRPMRQIEATELMVSANTFTLPYATMLVAATRPDMLVETKRPRSLQATPEDITRMERQLEKLSQDYKVDEEILGETMLVLVVAKGFVGRLLRNDAISRYLARNHGDLMGELSAIIEAVASEARASVRE